MLIFPVSRLKVKKMRRFSKKLCSRATSRPQLLEALESIGLSTINLWISIQYYLPTPSCPLLGHTTKLLLKNSQEERHLKLKHSLGLSCQLVRAQCFGSHLLRDAELACSYWQYIGLETSSVFSFLFRFHIFVNG